MDAPVSVQRPRPQHLSLSFGGSLPDLKSYTASLKPPTCDWISNYRNITSATLKCSTAASGDKVSLKQEFIVWKKQIELSQAEKNKVLEVDSETNSSENLNKLSSRSSHRNSSHAGSPTMSETQTKLAKQSQEIEGLKEQVKRISDENVKLTEERDFLRACLENKGDEILPTIASKDAKINALEEEMKMFMQQQEDLKQIISAFEEEMKTKNLHIEALVSDVNQMKEFIIEHHGESVFEGEEKEAQEHAKEEQEECPEETGTEATEATDIREDQESLIISDEKEEAPKKKVTVIIEQPVYHHYAHRGHYESGYDRDSYESYDRRRPYRNSRTWKDDQVVYQPKSSSRGFEEKEEYASRQSRDVKETKFDPFKDRRTRDDDPVYKQLELMIKELNEKLINNEKKAKKFCEEKLLEAAKLQSEKEESLLAEVEKLKDEKKGLLKKIDDMQWDQAYEYTQKIKNEKQEEEKALEAAKKQKIASLESNKKKKKK